MITVSAVATSLALIGYSAHAMIEYSHTRALSDSIPIITSFLANFFGALGIRSLTFTIIPEIMPEKIRDVGVTFCCAFYWMCSYIISIFYHARGGLLEPILAAVCLVGAVIIHLILPETKGKSRQEIMRSL